MGMRVFFVSHDGVLRSSHDEILRVSHDEVLGQECLRSNRSSQNESKSCGRGVLEKETLSFVEYLATLGLLADRELSGVVRNFVGWQVQKFEEC
jgi:hypothetical protein